MCAFATAVLSVDVAGQVREIPSLRGHAATWWNKQLEEQRRETGAKLEAAGADALPLLVWLLRNGSRSASYDAVATMTKLGPRAKPAAASLLDALQNHESSSVRSQSALALAAIGDNRRPVRDALLRHVCTSDVPGLRQKCAAALAQLTPAAPSILLAAVSEGRFAVLDQAIAVLRRFGERAVPSLLANIDRGDRRGHVAREALVGIGWTVVSRLQQAGYAELAKRALREGALREIMGVEPYAVILPSDQPPVQALPSLEFAHGSGHGNTMSVWRAAESPRGFRIERAVVVATYLAGKDSCSYELQTESLVLPRARALDMTRQLQVLARLELKLRSGEPETWMSSANFFSAVRLHVGERQVLDAKFADYARGDNVLQRFRAEAARNVLFEATRGFEWKQRAPVTADLDAVVAMRRRDKGDQSWWIDRRLQGLLDALAEALR